jgi:hypothetical protein
VATADANDEAAFCEDHADLSGFGPRRRGNPAGEQQGQGSSEQSGVVDSHALFSNVDISLGWNGIDQG